MISKKVYFMVPVLVLLLISLCPPLVLNGVCTPGNEITLHIPGETQRTRAGNSVLVAGLWHYLNVTLIDSEPSKLSVTMYKGDTLPTSGERNENTYYEWEYNNENWNEVTEYGGTTYSYIDTTNCKKTGNTYSFYIGIKDVVENTNIDAIDYDNWTLEIKADNTVIKSSGLIVEEPVTGFGPRSPEFYLNCEPFTSTIIKPDHTFGIINTRNVPFAINLTYTQFTDRIGTTNVEAIIHPNSTTTHEITINTLPWPPGIITISGSIEAIPMYVVQTGGFASLISTLVLDFPYIEISVGHSNYTIYESPTTDVVFQHEEELDAEYDEIKDITTYISGNGNVSIKKITCENATLLKVKVNDETIGDMPFLVHSTNLTEQQVVTQVHFTKENTTAFIHYEIETNGENLTFTTQITVGPKPSQEEKPPDTTLVMTIIGICIIAVIGYMIYSQMKYRRG